MNRVDDRGFNCALVLVAARSRVLMSPALFLKLSFANQIATAWASDLLISASVFFIFAAIVLQTRYANGAAGVMFEADCVFKLLNQLLRRILHNVTIS